MVRVVGGAGSSSLEASGKDDHVTVQRLAGERQTRGGMTCGRVQDGLSRRFRVFKRDALTISRPYVIIFAYDHFSDTGASRP